MGLEFDYISLKYRNLVPPNEIPLLTSFQLIKEGVTNANPPTNYHHVGSHRHWKNKFIR